MSGIGTGTRRFRAFTWLAFRSVVLRSFWRAEGGHYAVISGICVYFTEAYISTEVDSMELKRVKLCVCFWCRVDEKVYECVIDECAICQCQKV